MKGAMAAFWRGEAAGTLHSRIGAAASLMRLCAHPTRATYNQLTAVNRSFTLYYKNAYPSTVMTLMLRESVELGTERSRWIR